MAVALIGIGMLWTLLAGVAPATTTAQAPSRPADWTEASHGDGAAPAYDRLFAVDRVHEVRITIAPEDFRTMQADLQEVTARPRGRRGFRGDAGRGGAPVLISRDPIYVPVTVGYDGRRWTQVGMRYKGNSSLAAARGGANGKLPFRLDFDRYEDDAPETSNQRFHGFSELTFSSNFADDSQLREVLSAEILRDRGVRVARTAFYRVHVDVGTGPEYWGLYTVVEDPAEGAMLDEQFGSRDGNVYKPDGPGADWTRFEPEGFDKKNNEDEADFSDVEAAIAALHAPMDDPGAWRQALERRFDVDGFLRWLKLFSNRPCTTWGGRGTSARTDAGGPMRAYSMDLRERARLDSDAGMKAADVAAKYRVSGSWVRLLKQRRRETGEVAPRVQRHGRRGMLEPHLHPLAALIAAHPDRTLAELNDALATPARVPTVWRAVRALGLTVNKNGPPVRTRSA